MTVPRDVFISSQPSELLLSYFLSRLNYFWSIDYPFTYNNNNNNSTIMIIIIIAGRCVSRCPGVLWRRFPLQQR